MSVRLEGVELPLAGFTLEVSADLGARTTAVCGPSGAGKTSLIEIIAGLRMPTAGRVTIGDRVVFDSAAKINVPARARHAGYLPQDDALFPHLSVRGNILYGSHSRNGAGPFTLEHVESVLEIDHVAARGVQKLSGGERKRVALARALLSRPEILLLDEPLAGVHVELRARVLDYLVRVRDEFTIPIIYVTHELAEAAAVCEELLTLVGGRVTGQRKA